MSLVSVRVRVIGAVESMVINDAKSHWISESILNFGWR